MVCQAGKCHVSPLPVPTNNSVLYLAELTVEPEAKWLRQPLADSFSMEEVMSLWSYPVGMKVSGS